MTDESNEEMIEILEKIKTAYTKQLREVVDVVNSGILTEELTKEIKENIKSHKYLEHVTDYYDDPTDPEHNNWTDVEGFGYGWLWDKHDEKDWHRMMSEEINTSLLSLEDNIGKSYYIMQEIDDGLCYWIITWNNLSYSDCRVDEIIRMSNKGLDF